MNKDLSLEEMQQIVDEKAAELSTKMKLKVTPLLFNHNNEWIVGYLKQPNRTTVRAAVDRMEKYGRLEAGDLLLQFCLIQEESDKRIISELPEFDAINMGAALESLQTMEVNMSVTKKNMTNS